MAQSREEFMRAMGITADDALDPSQKETKFVTAFTADAGGHSSNRSMDSGERRSYSGSSGPAPSAQPLRSTYKAEPSPSYDSREQSSAYSSAPAPTTSDSYSSKRMYEQDSPVKAPTTAGAGAGGANSSARADFLASLGIDNMDHPDSMGAPTPPKRTTGAAKSSYESTASPYAPPPPPRNQTASQEYMKDANMAASSGYAHSSGVLGSSAKKNQLGGSPKGGSFTKTLVQRNSTFSSEEEEAYPPRDSYKPPIKQDSIMGMRKTRSGLNSSSSQPDATDNWTVDEIKAKGNKYFEDGEFRKAVRMYSKGIEKDSTNAALYSNRSAAYLQASKQMGIDTRMMALRDADKVIELKPTWFKGHSRRGDALFKLDRPSEAAEAYQRGLELDEGNVNLMHSLGEAKNAAGGTRPAHASSWATAKKERTADGNGCSAHQLVDQLHENMRRTNPDALMGHDYRAEALEKFRAGKATSSLSSFCGEPSTSSASSSSFVASSQQQQQRQSASPTMKRLDRSQITEEFSSAAAHNYQQGLLEAYRQKKQQR